MSICGILYAVCTPLFFNLAFAQNSDSNCTFEPVSIPIKWATLPNKGSIRGGAVSMGTPAQNFSVLPIVEINNTYLFQRFDGCDITEAACRTHRGGFFIPEDSDSYKSDIAASPTSPQWEASETLTSGGIGSDSFVLNGNTTISQFPFGVVEKEITVNHAGGNGQASFGLGRNSTILSMLKSAGKIGSSSWGYWWGLDGATDPAKMDGNLVFGGYDRAKIKNPEKNHTGKFTERGLCPQGMTVTFNEIRLNFPNGSQPNLLQSSPLQACVCPQCTNVMTLPYDPYYARFETWTEAVAINRSLGINFFDMMYHVDEVYQGDLTLVLDTGLEIRILNSQLAIPDLTIGGDGRIDGNMSVRDLTLYSLQDINRFDMPRLGRVFFTGAYLWVNNDEETFTIWEANPTTESELVSVTEPKSHEECSASSQLIGPSTTPTGTATQAAGGTSPTGGTLKGGAIAGIVVGVLVALSLFGFSIYWILAKRQTRLAASAPDYVDSYPEVDFHPEKRKQQVNAGTPLVEMWGAHASEMRGDMASPQELYSERDGGPASVHELPSST
ncbi:aspartic peptidase domain-containing protein [Massariosphaeria phaeospora]|uniref:Aspartic peptidase domain-containing protein n=1 Tax=Massariosphaeria phaeospora TaxID=100035 RepID=A0A7C8MQF8_9PLEO|nr:aspartic peptidase domain-containing protein [Massariosphaeria phaeospora]